MKVVSLKINNILSIENAEVKFADKGLVLVEGWNFDDGRANGAGKTAIFNALSFAMFNDMPRKITASEILRDGQKSGYAHAVIDVDGDIYEVIRSRPKGVKFLLNGIEKDLTQDEFEANIKLSYSQFLVTAYNAQSGSSRFLSLNDSQKKEFLVKLMNLDDISRCKKLIDSTIKDLETSSKVEDAVIEQANAKLEVYKESKIDIKDIHSQITTLDDACKSLVSKISDLRSVPKPKTTELDIKEEALWEKLNTIAQAKTKRSMLFDTHRKIVAKDKPFSGEDSCNKCGSKVDISEAKQMHAKHLEEFRAEAADLNSKISLLDRMLAKEKEIKDAMTSIKQDRIKQFSDHSTANDTATQLNSLLASNKNKIEALQLASSRAIENQKKMSNLEDVIKKAESKLSSLKVSLAIQSSLQTLYSSTGVAAYILDSAVTTFNDSVAEYVGMIWPNASYILKSYKENSTGEIVAKFSEELVINGKIKSVGSLSGGEHRALSLAIDFAVMDVVLKNFNTSVNPIIMDEPFDALDITGKEIVMDLLEKLAIDKQIWVIDHSTEIKSMFSKVVRIEKRNDISTIVV